MKVSVKTGDLTKTSADLLAVNLFEGVKQPGGASGAVNKALGGLLSVLIKDEHFEGKEGQTLLVHTHGKIPAKRVLVVGLGKQDRFSPESIRRAAAYSYKKAKEVSARTVVSVLHGAGVGGTESYEAAEAMTEGVMLASYEYLKHKGKGDKGRKDSVNEFTIVERDADKVKKAIKGVEAGLVDAEATMYARNLVNEPPAYLTPTILAQEAQQLARTGVVVKIYDRRAIAKLGLHAFLAVAKGSSEEPRFIHLIYRPKKAFRPFDPTQGALNKVEVRQNHGKPKRIVLVGKGITFDTGGLSIKDRKSMITMKLDMAGAAAVLGVFSVLSKLKITIEIHGLIAAAENMPSGNAYKPGDVVKALNGKTIEVIDTDAEGRITLADALSYGAALKPAAIVDLATLTGSVIAGLGEEVAGLFGNDDKLTDEILAAAKSAGENMWHLPLVEDYKETMVSKVADFKNVGGKDGDAIKASLLLNEFVEKRPWVHLDIAGPAWAENERIPYIQEGGTGFGVRTLLHYLRAVGQ